MTDRERLYEVWMLHCRGMTVPEIASRLMTSPDEVRLVIRAIWRTQGDEEGD